MEQYTVVWGDEDEDRHSMTVEARNPNHALQLVSGFSAGYETVEAKTPDEWQGAHYGTKDYDDWRKDALVAEADKRDLDSTGTRADLIERLREDDEA